MFFIDCKVLHFACKSNCINTSKIHKVIKFTQYDMKSTHINLSIIVQIYKGAIVIKHTQGYCSFV